MASPAYCPPLHPTTRRLAYDLIQGIHGYIEPHAVGWHRFFRHHRDQGYLIATEDLSICYHACVLAHPAAAELA